MKAPLSWLAEYAALPADLDGRALAEAYVRAGLEVEAVEQAGADVTGPLVVGRVLSAEPEQHKNGKTINWCRVDVGDHNDPADGEQPASRGIVCGAHNFGAGDLVVVALPGVVLPGDFAIAARKTYGHVSDGMICSARELGLGEDHDGIIVLEDADLVPGADAAEVLHLRETVLDLDVTPDRGYCLSLRGLAREAAQATGTTFTDPVDRPVPAEVADGHPVRRESDGCPLFVALTVTGIDPTRPSPRWLARRVQLAGMRPISLAVDITNYVMLETGQPLHAYDADRLAGALVARQATPGERLTTLDDVERSLDPADLVIADDSGAIGLAGVMGGASSELSASTTSVVLEAAHFDALTLARTSRRHRLTSEASRRFERGVDPGAAYAAAHRAAALLVELAGGTLEAGETVSGSVPPGATTVLDADLAPRVLGVALTTAQVVGHLESVGAAVVVDGASLRATAPTWRPDLTDPYDYVEEVGRLVGYDNIPLAVPPAPVGRGLTPEQRARRAVTAAAAGAGFVEVLSFPFTAAEDLDRMGVPADDRRRRLTRVLNPLAETSPYLRTSVLPGLFAAVTRNTSRGNDDLALFETGAVFFAPEPRTAAPRPSVSGRPSAADLEAMDEALGDQPRHLAAVLTGAWRRPGWDTPGERAGWTHALALADLVGATVGLQLERRAADVAPWHPGRCAAVVLPGTDVVLGHAGELHPSVIAAFGLPPRTAALEIDLDVLVAGAPAVGRIVPLSSHPVAKEDVALVVDASVPAADVAAALEAGAGELLESVQLFDIYTGPQIGEGRKSLAFALRFRAADRTLTDAETGAARDAAVARAAQDTGAVQRTE
ncbi:phenylalanine--tRNA ligase subunit beta [Microlunatus capsulatus]|uniref:Phenylalanine--tRNA ligase beta subunit n=1 Tax=Microlunatus capsulatus TaxID=99117 RepID=A0ABS4ZCE4_9ACTN|nr:phenylalanine--tRNA ligase subunit beta [Microlunatus capsulatus]MBP2418721.1 phenylalanyl-tRNA synthetase beta chain [Microlunatus capsulatus]